MLQGYAQYWHLRKGSWNSFSTIFWTPYQYVWTWYFKKNVSYVIFYQLTNFHRPIVFTSWHNSQYVYCNCLLTRLWVKSSQMKCKDTYQKWRCTKYANIRVFSGQRKPVFWHTINSVKYLGSGAPVLGLATCDPSTLHRWTLMLICCLYNIFRSKFH